MKYFLNFIIVIFVSIVQFAFAHTFPECPQQDEEIRIKEKSVLNFKNNLNNSRFSFFDFIFHRGNWHEGFNLNNEVNSFFEYFHLLYKNTGNEGYVCVSDYYDSAGNRKIGFFRAIRNEIYYLLPGYNLEGIPVASRGNYKNGEKEGYWEYYYTNENNGNQKGEYFSFGFYKNGNREGIWFEFPLRTTQREEYPSVITYKEGKKHGPFVNAFKIENGLEYGSFKPAINENVDFGSFNNGKKDGFWSYDCKGIGGTGLCDPVWETVTFKKNYSNGILNGIQMYHSKKEDSWAKGFVIRGNKEGWWTFTKFHNDGFKELDKNKKDYGEWYWWKTIHKKKFKNGNLIQVISPYRCGGPDCN